MNCDLAHERLLAQPAGSRPDGDITAHLAECPACAARAKQVRAVDSLVAGLPVVDSTPAKAAFLASLTSGTTIRPTSKPVWLPILKNPTVRTVLALAAVVLIAIGLTSFLPRSDQNQTQLAATKHQLLDRAVAFAVDHSRQPNSAKRMQSSTAFAGDLLAEVRGVYQVATPGDLDAIRSLSDLFAKTLREGVAGPSSEPGGANPLERKADFDLLMPALEGYAQAAREWSLTAPEHVKPILAQIQQSATTTSSALIALGASKSSPRPSPVALGQDAGRELLALKANRAVIEVLTNRSLKAGTAADAVDRADEIRAGAAAIETALARAVAEGDADRSADLGEHLAIMLVSAVKPAVDDATAGATNPESPSYSRVMALKIRAKEDATRARAALPDTGRLADHPRVKAARKSLDDAAGRIL
jgi:hypothetical protein